MLKENDNKKDELNEVFSIKGEDLKIEDTIPIASLKFVFPPNSTKESIKINSFS